VNSFLVSSHSFAPLQFNYDEKLLEGCDKLLIKNVSKGCGLSMSDAKHRLFLNKKDLGFGLKSFIDVDIISNARELEIVPNTNAYCMPTGY